MKKRGGIRVAAWLLLTVLLISSCRKGSGTATFTYQDRKYCDGNTGVCYSIAPDRYHAATYAEDDIVGIYRDKQGKAYCFYAVEGLEGILTDESHLLYVADGVTLPTLSGMGVSLIDVCRSDVYTVSVATIDDAETLESVIRSCESEAALDYEKIHLTATERYDLVFTSSKESGYPNLCYTLEYLTFAEEVLIYAPLTAGGEIPDLYPGIPASIAEGTAVFHFGKQLIYDRTAGVCHAVANLLGQSEA